MFRIGLLAVTIGVLSSGGPAQADEHATPGDARRANRLIDSNDPYLLLHAHNPVDWYPWGPEALEKAKREQKPIFLSVGYSTCYWCHVAEQTIYSRQAFADLMNAWFVNIKVDREQRPDIDRLYMAATQAMTGRGGWPNNVFLTPDLKPFFAGSYFPPHDDEFGRPGFDSIIRSIHASWVQDPKRVRETAEKMIAALRARQATPAGKVEPIDPAALSERALEIWGERADNVHGGFGPAKGPRFPQQPLLSLLMADAHIDRLGLLTRALDGMAAGGIYDHIGGGFHRYAIEPSWSIPHFEKMLGDNAQLLEIYAQAFSLTGEPRYRVVATEVADYLMGRMMAQAGGFYTAQDAAVDGHEGQSYAWTREEIVAVLGDEAAARFFAVYQLTPMSASRQQIAEQLLNGESQGVLRRRRTDGASSQGGEGPQTPSGVAEFSSWRRALLQARDLRRQPDRDEKQVVALNGLAIQAFARAGQWLGRPQYVEAALHSGEHIWQVAYDANGTLRHEIFRGRAQTAAFLDDYALLGLGFVALHGATGDDKWKQRARQLADDLLAHFRRADGSLATTTAEKDLPLPPPENGDNVSPSASSAAVDLLLSLDRLTGTNQYAAAAQEIVRRLGHRLQDTPDSWPSMLRALDEHHFVPSTIRSAIATQAVVLVSAAARTGTGQDEIAITLQIEDGYHVNANPATYDYLIATSVSFDRLTPNRVLYPQATLFKPGFAPAGLKVYEGKVTLIALFPKGAIGNHEQLNVTVSTQACNSEICLPPAKLTVNVIHDGS